MSRNSWRLNAQQRFAYLKDRVARFGSAWRIHALQYVYDWCVRRKKSIPRITSEIKYANRWADQFYQRQPCSGTVALFKTIDPAGGIYPAPLMGWEGLLQGKVDVYDLPGEHLQMLSKPTVNKVAQAFQERLLAATSLS